jgi:hypothetical protein
MSMAAVFWDIKKLSILQGTLDFYILPKLDFSKSLIKLISSFLSQRKFRVSIEGEMPTPNEMQAEAPQYCISACCCLPNVSSGFGSF